MSDLTVSPGYKTIEEEFEASLRRAFVDNKLPSIAIYSRRERFRGESASYGVNQGWLEGELIEHDEQSSELRFTLTTAGRTHFGLKQ